MSYADLKPVKFDFDIQYQPSSQHPPYYNSFGIAEPDPRHNLYAPTAPPHHHHHHHQHQPQQHLHYMIDSQDSDSQDSVDSFRTPAPISSATRFSTHTPRASRASSNDSESGELSEEVMNHWLPMTWCERSSDDPQVFTFVCLWGQCVSSSSSKDEFVDHLFGHVSVIEEGVQNGNHMNTVQCKVRGCNKHLDSIFQLHRHVSMHVFQADCQQKGSEALIEKEDYIGIESCGFEPCTNINYEGMLLNCQWEDCGMPFNSLTELFDHVGHHIDGVGDVDRIQQNFSNGDKKVVSPCKWTACTQVADSKANLRRHARHHSGEKVLACPFCARFFSRRDKLYDHCLRRTILMKNPEMEDPYLCKLCQKRFGTEKALCMHVTRHLVSLTCPLCSLGLGCRAELHRHLMTKHSRRSKDFKCDTCSKLFFTESELNRHAVYHSDVMYSCKHCPEKFKWKKQLMKHMKEHDENFNPSPYTCHLCDRTYTTGFALGRHLTRQHRLQIPYGFSRFTYKKCADGLMRLQTKKLFRGESGEDQAHHHHQHVPY